MSADTLRSQPFQREDRSSTMLFINEIVKSYLTSIPVTSLASAAVIKAAKETKAIVTAEEHQVGGIGNRIAGIIMNEMSSIGKAIPFGMIGVQDRFGESGLPWQLVKEFGVAGEYIADKARKLLKLG